MNEIEVLLQSISKHWGWHVGNKVKQEIEAVIGARDVDIQQLQSAIQTIQGLLDADPGTPEFDVGQNIVTQLSDNLTRITNLETDVATLNGDENTVGSVAYAVKQERERAIDAETALQAGIDANAADIATLKGDETVEGSVAKKIKDAVDDAAAVLYEQIYNMTEGESGPISSLQSEFDEIKVIAYTNEEDIITLKGDENTDGSVLKTAKDAASSAGAAAVATAKQYADATFVRKDDVSGISVETLVSMFRQALDCGFNGATIYDVLNGTGDCAQASGGTGGDGGDGAVI